ncbi:AAA+ ATPase domain-containing protein [Tanacetum coccineum]
MEVPQSATKAKGGRRWQSEEKIHGVAMANYLKFDIYDLQLMHVEDDSSLKDILLRTSNRSILVIEDIDCSILPDREGLASSYESHLLDPKFTLSGLLNFIDGLWSCCGNERIFIFTTNHKERLDSALLRLGRMDVHIHMSYLSMEGFKTLAANYLNIQNHHWRFTEVKELIECNKVTPAEVAEELMKSSNAEVVLEGLASFLKRKKKDGDEVNKGTEDEDNGIREAKKAKITS